MLTLIPLFRELPKPLDIGPMIIGCTLMFAWIISWGTDALLFIMQAIIETLGLSICLHFMRYEDFVPKFPSIQKSRCYKCI